MAAKATAKPKVKNGVTKVEPVISISDFDNLLLRMDKCEESNDRCYKKIDELFHRMHKVESRLGIG